VIPRLKPAINWREFIKIFQPARKDAVTRFEHAFAKKFHKQYAVAFPYGRTGLIFLLQAMGLKGKEIICPAYTCVVVAHAILKSGNEPVFVDSDYADFNMDLCLAEKEINANTGAIIATSIHGYPVNLVKLREIKQRYPHIKIIQDCAHSFSASWYGEAVELVGDAVFYGLNISKLITSIFGGMVLTDDKQLYEKLRQYACRNLTQVGFIRSLRRRVYLLCIFMAFNFWIYKLINWLERRGALNYFVKYYDESIVSMPSDFLKSMAPFEAEIGLIQLEKYESIVSFRRSAASTYSAAFKKIDQLILPPLIKGATYSHYVIRVHDRERLLKFALSKGVQLGSLIEYSVPLMKAYAAKNVAVQSNFPVSEKLSKTVVNLPIWLGVKCNKIIEVITLFYRDIDEE